MSKLILTYFDFPGGRGEASRLALHIGGADWTDNRFNGDWPATKPSIPFGGLPTLEVPGKGLLTQSNAVLAYIGREYGLLPTDAWAVARHESVMSAVESLRAQVATTAHKDEDAKRKAREEFASGYFQHWAKSASELIQGPFIGGDTISVADLKLFVALRSYNKGVYDHVPTDILDPFPKLTGLIKACAEHPRVVDWYSEG